MREPIRSSTLQFDNVGEARMFASMMDFRKISQLPETYVGEGYDDDGSRLSFIMRKCGENAFDLHEYAMKRAH